MKWNRTYKYLIPIAIIIGCIAAGAIEGTHRADETIAKHSHNVDNPDHFRAQIRSRIITGNLIIGTPFALVLFFALMMFNNKKHNRPQNNRFQAIDAKASKPDP